MRHSAIYLTLLLLLKMTSAQQMPSKAEREKYVSPDKYKYAPLWVRAAPAQTVNTLAMAGALSGVMSLATVNDCSGLCY